MTALLLAWTAGTSHAAETAGAGDVFDGPWTVALTCDDTQDRHGSVKGYRYDFPVVVEQGRLHGRYGSEGAPASVVFDGTVRADGSLEIRAVGRTGSPEYAVGQAARGTAYAYTLAGRLDASGGRATRREVRPCTAVFGRP